MHPLQPIIEAAWDDRSLLQSPETQSTIRQCIELLNTGEIRVANQTGPGQWIVNDWVKKAITLYFPIQSMETIEVGPFEFHDKIPLKKGFAAQGVRVVPHALVRTGTFVEAGAILMPSYVNIGAYVGSGTMVDTWATVGSCAQIGRNVHLSGGVGIGGVLEPPQASPNIIEDDCFIGARSEVVEGVIVERGSVIGMGVFLGQSTRIYDRATRETSYGRVPAGSVVVAGSLPAADGSHSLYAASSVKRVDEKTRAKTSLNELLRE